MDRTLQGTWHAEMRRDLSVSEEERLSRNLEAGVCIQLHDGRAALGRDS
jgi:hypothetical protein